MLHFNSTNQTRSLRRRVNRTHMAAVTHKHGHVHTPVACMAVHHLSVRPWGASVGPRTQKDLQKKEGGGKGINVHVLIEQHTPRSISHTSARLKHTKSPSRPPCLWPASRRPTWRHRFPHINAATVKSPMQQSWKGGNKEEQIGREAMHDSYIMSEIPKSLFSFSRGSC